MGTQSRSAHIAKNSVLPADISFCLEHKQVDYWQSGKFRQKPGTSTCVPSDVPSERKFVLYMTASEIQAGLTKGRRLHIEYDDSGASKEKRITKYYFEPVFGFSVNLPGFTARACITVSNPAAAHHGLRRWLPRIQLDAEVVLFDSVRFFSGARPTSETDEAYASDGEPDVDEPGRPPGPTVEEVRPSN